MNLIRRSAWVVALAGAVAGCNTEEGTTPSTSTPAVNPMMAPAKPVVPPASKGEPTAKETPKAEAPAATPGESKKGEESPKLEGPKSEAGKGDSAAAKLTADEIAAIKQLPAADQELALKQAVCPVSNEHLGEMGKPVKTMVEGRAVFLCCENCEKEVKADPKKIIAKLDAQAKK